MKNLFTTIFLVLFYLSSTSQISENKMLLGLSVNYSHDGVNNNRLLSNVISYDVNYTEKFELLGEMNFYLKPNHLIGIELGYNTKSSKQENPATDQVYESKLNTSIKGILLNPKYKFIADFSDKILFFTDFKVMLQYFRHNNQVTQLDYYTNRVNLLKMNGTEFRYGIGINPGLIFKIRQNLGLKIDYSLFSATNSTIKETDDNEIDFDKINACDYHLNFKLTELNIGVILTL